MYYYYVCYDHFTTSIPLYRPSMSAIYLPNLCCCFFPEVLRNSVWFDGSKCDLDQSGGPFAPTKLHRFVMSTSRC